MHATLQATVPATITVAFEEVDLGSGNNKIDDIATRLTKRFSASKAEQIRQQSPLHRTAALSIRFTTPLSDRELRKRREVIDSIVQEVLTQESYTR